MKRTERLKTVDIKGKQYTEVSERVLFLANNFDYEIITSYEFFENQNMWVVRAELTIHEDNKQRKFTGVAQEIIGEGYINKTSALENCETSAVGRACAMAGIGVIESVASADEINKANAIEYYNTKNQSATTNVKVDKWLSPSEFEKAKTFDKKKVNSLLSKYNGKTFSDGKVYSMKKEYRTELEKLK